MTIYGKILIIYFLIELILVFKFRYYLFNKQNKLLSGKMKFILFLSAFIILIINQYVRNKTNLFILQELGIPGDFGPCLEECKKQIIYDRYSKIVVLIILLIIDVLLLKFVKVKNQQIVLSVILFIIIILIRYLNGIYSHFIY